MVASTVSEMRGESLQSIQKRLSALTFEAQRIAYTDGFFEAAKVVEQVARSTTAFDDDSGLLRRNIKARKRKSRVRTKTSPQLYAVVSAGGRRAPHGVIIQTGRKSPRPSRPRPFLYPALEESESRLLPAIKRGIVRNFPKLEAKLRTIK